MPEDNPQKPKRVAIAELPRTRPDRFVSVYANHTEGTPGFYELDLVFCRIGKSSSGQLAIEEEAQIVLSWEHVLRVRNLLNRMVDAYEKQQGKIRFMQEEDEEEGKDAIPEPPSQ
jgi:hypothetical protein